MATTTKTFQLTAPEADQNVTKTLTGTFDLPDATSIRSVTTSPSVSASKIQYTFSAGKLNVTLKDVQSSRSNQVMIPGTLTSWGVHPDGRQCWYSNGANFTVAGTCPTSYNVYQTRYFYEYSINVEYETNRIPSITLDTTNARTLYENDTINIAGTVQDADTGNVKMVKYQINGGTTRTIHTSVSDGTATPFNRVLTFKANKLYDGSTAVTPDLTQGAQHVIKVWAEDDQGGRSADILRTFQVVPNRPATLTIEPIAPADGLIDSDKITVRGSVADPDGNTVTVEYKIGNGTFASVYNGADGTFSFDVPLSALASGDSTLTIRATDSYGATSTKALKITKAGAVTPLKKSVVTYRITPPNGSAQGAMLWIERESGDLAVTAEISMTAEGDAENWQAMTKNSTAYVDDGVEEDEWVFEGVAPVEKILLRLTLERQDANSTAGVRLISGVLS